MTSPTDARQSFRNSKWVLREYDSEKWSKVLASIDALISGGESNASRIISQLCEDEMRELGSWKDGLNLQPSIADGKPLVVPYSVSWWGSFGLMRDYLLTACGGNANSIIELGSGWGRNLFALWLSSGPLNAQYFALEFTPSGRACSDRLAELLPDMNLRSMEFNYNKPDFSALEIDDGKVIAFSAHSIEQIPQIDDQFIRKLIEAAPRLECIHFEPVGWQIRDDIGGDGEGTSREHAERHDYSRNFWQMLKGLQDEGLIRIEEVFPEAYGHTAPNSYSIIKWRPA